MLFKEVVHFFEQLEKTASRLEMINILECLFSNTNSKSNDLSELCYILSDSVFLPWEEKKIGLAEKMVLKALAKRSRTLTPNKLEVLLQKYGDIGIIAEKVTRKAVQQTLVTPKPLHLNDVYSTLRSIAFLEGKGSTSNKLDYLIKLFNPATPLEARYLARAIIGDLRLGIGVQTVLEALASYLLGTREQKKELERVYNVLPDIGAVINHIKKHGKEKLSISPQVGVPIRPMAAQRLSSPEEIIEKMKEGCIAEWKYDGERVQIHKDNNMIKLYSRNLDLITSQFPDAVDYIHEFPAYKAILEGEIVCYDFQNDQFQPFQKLMRRRRKYGVKEASKEFPIVLFLFDLMVIQETTESEFLVLLDSPYPERRHLLTKLVKKANSKFLQLTRGQQTQTVEEIEKAFLEATQMGTEGVIAKSISNNSKYQAGARGWNWIKLKKDYISGLADTLDLILIGGFHGKGRRTSMYGAFLLGAYDPDQEKIFSVCKVGTGFSDEVLLELSKLGNQLLTKKPDPRFNTNLIPDKWFTPKLVFEVQGAELTLSPTHTCGGGRIKNEEKKTGIALRFPRFIKLRQDKQIGEATSVSEIVDLYQQQQEPA